MVLVVCQTGKLGMNEVEEGLVTLEEVGSPGATRFLSAIPRDMLGFASGCFFGVCEEPGHRTRKDEAFGGGS